MVMTMEVVAVKHDFVQMMLFRSYELEHHCLMGARVFVLE